MILFIANDTEKSEEICFVTNTHLLSQTHIHKTTRTHPHMHTCSYTYTHTGPHVHPLPHVHIHAHMPTYKHTHTQATCTHTHTCTHTCTQATCTHTHVHTHAYMPTGIHPTHRPHVHAPTHVRAHTHTPTLTHTCTHPHTHAHIRTPPHAYAPAHTCIHTRTHAHTSTHVHTPSHVNTHAHTHAHTHTHPHTYTHMLGVQEVPFDSSGSSLYKTVCEPNVQWQRQAHPTMLLSAHTHRSSGFRNESPPGMSTHVCRTRRPALWSPELRVQSPPPTLEAEHTQVFWVQAPSLGKASVCSMQTSCQQPVTWLSEIQACSPLPNAWLLCTSAKQKLGHGFGWSRKD